MYLLLLVFGGLLGAAGVVLAGSGMSLRDGTFDPAILTPGIVAAAGGLLLIGLGAGLRTLQRIERTLASRPMPRASALHRYAAAASAARASERIRSTMERKPFERCGVRCSRKPMPSNSLTASVFRICLALLPE